MTFPHFVWTNTGNYPAGSNPWNGQPLALSPAQSYFTPALKPSPEEFNYILGQISTELEYLFSNTPVAKTATYGVYNVVGTFAVTNGLATVVGTSTTFGTDVFVGTTLVIASNDYIVVSIADATHLTLNTPISTSTASGLTVATNGGVWTCPPGVTSVDVECVGAAGGGGGGSAGENGPGVAPSGGGGGAGSQVASRNGVPVVAGSDYIAVPGTGGAGGAGGTTGAGSNGGDGQDSTFGIVLGAIFVTGKGAQGGTGAGGLDSRQAGTGSTTCITPGGSGPAGSFNLPSFSISALNVGFSIMRNPSEGGAGTGDALFNLGLTFKGNLSTLGGIIGLAGLTGANSSSYGGGGSGGGGGAGPGAGRSFTTGSGGGGGTGGDANAVGGNTGGLGGFGFTGGPGQGGGGGGGGGSGSSAGGHGGVGGNGGFGWVTLSWVEFDSNPIG